MPSTAAVPTLLAETPVAAHSAPAVQSAADSAATPPPTAHRSNPATVTATDPVVLSIFHHHRRLAAVIAASFARRVESRHRDDIRQVADYGLLRAAIAAARQGYQPTDVCDTYIRQCVAGRIRDYFRKVYITTGSNRSGRRELVAGLEVLTPATEPAVESHCGQSTAIVDTDGLLQRLLADGYRLEYAVLTAYYHHGLTLREIGELIQRSEGRIGQIKSRALGILRGYVGRGQ